MSRYLNFETSFIHQEHFGPSAFFNDRLPSRFLPLKGVRINGTPVEFDDPATPERILKSIKDSQQLGPEQVADCQSFALLMAGHDLVGHKTTGKFLFDPEYNPNSAEEEWESGTIVDICKVNPDAGTIAPEHVISATPADREPFYAHQVGVDGRICLSGLDVAKRMYHATVALEVVAFTLSNGTEPLIQWPDGLPERVLQPSGNT